MRKNLPVSASMTASAIALCSGVCSGVHSGVYSGIRSGRRWARQWIRPLIRQRARQWASQWARQLCHQMNRPSLVTLIFTLVFSLALALSVHGCTSPAQTLQPLRIGLNSWPGYALAYYAERKSLFTQRGLAVELVEFNNQQDNIRATLRGALDASFVPLWEVMQADVGEAQPSLIMVADISAGSDGIVARSGIESVADLRGQKVGVKLGTVPHLVLLEALKAAQIPPEALELVDVSNELSIQQLHDGLLDAVVVWEPSLSETAEAIGGNVISTTADLDSLVIDSLVSRSSFVSEHSEALTQFTLAWLDAVHAVETRPDEVFATIGQVTGQSREAFAIGYGGLKKGDRGLNQRMFEAGRLPEAVAQIAQLLEADPRHSRVIRQDVEINSTPMTEAIRTWQALPSSSTR